MKIRELIKQAESELIASGKEKHPAKLLLMHYLQLESHDIIQQMDHELSIEIEDQFNKGLKEYIHGRPLQYIIGNEIFFGYQFKVNENVLIPRFETEELVANILERIDLHFEDYTSIDLVDIGTGSGAISITLALEESKLNVTATDISAEALEVATMNATNLGANVNFLCGDMLQPLKEEKFDIIVSNPPYIPSHEEISSLVKDNEPHVALFGGEDGLMFYRVILEGANKHLKEKGMLAFEIGYDQAERLSVLVEKYIPQSKYEILQDMQGRDRMLFVYVNINNQ